jgi:putative transposase
MARAYSNDLRERVVAAVERDGMSCRESAAHFSIGVSTAIRWAARYRRTGSVVPAKIGGYRPKSIAGSHREWLLERCRGSAFTLRGLVAELAERGLKVDYRTMWSFVQAEGLSFKKNRAGRRAGPRRHRPPPGAVAEVPAAN